MNVGFTIELRNPPQWRRPWIECWNDTFDWIVNAEKAGYDYVWVTEHFFQEDGYGPSMPAMIAVLCERTSTIRIGSGIYVLPLHHPVQLAQEAAVLDHLSGGRLNVGLGVGHRLLEYTAFGVPRQERGARMEEGLKVLKAAWTEHPFSFDGRFFHYDRLEVRPEPLQRPHPPIWVAATTIPAAERAGRHGAHLHASSVDTELYDAYRRELVRAGFDPGAARISNSWSATVTTDDPEAVWERNKAAYFHRYDFYGQIRSELGDPPLHGSSPVTDEYKGMELIGPPEWVLEQIEPVAKSLGVTDITLVAPAAGLDQRDVSESFRLLAQDVLPVLKSW